MVMRAAGPGVRAARDVYRTIPVDVVRVAALVEISAAAAALARTIVRLRRLDVRRVAPLVADPVDLWAVLGRGRWLPTMTRHVSAPPAGRDGLAVLASACPAPRRCPGLPGRGGPLTADAVVGEG